MRLLSRSFAPSSVSAWIGTGTHLIDASYPGNSSDSASTSATTGLTAQQLTPSVTVTLNPTSIATAQAFAVTITVGGGNGNPLTQGTVEACARSTKPTMTHHEMLLNTPAGCLLRRDDLRLSA